MLPTSNLLKLYPIIDAVFWGGYFLFLAGFYTYAFLNFIAIKNDSLSIEIFIIQSVITLFKYV